MMGKENQRVQAGAELPGTHPPELKMDRGHRNGHMWAADPLGLQRGSICSIMYCFSEEPCIAHPLVTKGETETQTGKLSVHSHILSDSRGSRTWASVMAPWI